HRRRPVPGSGSAAEVVVYLESELGAGRGNASPLHVGTNRNRHEGLVPSRRVHQRQIAGSAQHGLDAGYRLAAELLTERGIKAMKKGLTVLILAAAAPLLAGNNGTLSDTERSYLVEQLEQSKKAMLASIQGLSDAQWRFKPAPEVWSVQECAEHII